MSTMSASAASDTAEVIGALSTLLWVGLILTVVLLFRANVEALIDRIRRVTGPGGIGLELDRLKEELEAAGDALPETTATSAGGEQADEAEAEETRVYELAATSPRVALMALAADIEREVREHLAAWGGFEGQAGEPSLTWRDLGLRRGLDKLVRLAGLPPGLVRSLQDFIAVRNRVVHGASVSAEDTLRAIDIGASLLMLLRSIPRERKFVVNPAIPIFRDRELSEPLDGHGVMLEMRGAEGTAVRRQVFPTTREHFVAGKEVAWEWNPDRIWKEAWYRNPETNEAEVGWSSSMEFIGRHLDDLA